jgi:hypothetical protein
VLLPEATGEGELFEPISPIGQYHVAHPSEVGKKGRVYASPECRHYILLGRTEKRRAQTIMQGDRIAKIYLSLTVLRYNSQISTRDPNMKMDLEEHSSSF